MFCWRLPLIASCQVVPSFPPVVSGAEAYPFPVARGKHNRFRTFSFPMTFLTTTSASALLFGNYWQLFLSIHLFSYLFIQYPMGRSITLHVFVQSKKGMKHGVVWFGLVLYHTNQCRLFNAKSIFIHINSSISNNSAKHKCQNSTISNNTI